MKNLYEKLKHIKLVVLDFDGVITDGGIYLDCNSQGFRRFDVKDGLGIKLLQKNHFKVAIISGSNSDIIDHRAKALGIKIVRRGIACKLKALQDIQNDLNIKVEETIFLGDDINDLSVLPDVSLFIVPSDAHIGCKRKASYISKSLGGKGFIREIVDNLIISQNLDPYLPFATKND
tara:strand:+ start:330 stop:857 length:528 start_codon:yes stop_codon:yes gene_type:complete